MRLLVVSGIDQNYQFKGLSNQLTLEVGLPYVSKKILRNTFGTVFVIPRKKCSFRGFCASRNSKRNGKKSPRFNSHGLDKQSHGLKMKITFTFSASTLMAPIITLYDTLTASIITPKASYTSILTASRLYCPFHSRSRPLWALSRPLWHFHELFKHCHVLYQHC